MKRIRELEELLLRFEAAVAVVLVLVMLAMASYNVLYRNVLVPIQRHYAESGPPIEPKLAPAAAAETPAPVADREVAPKATAPAEPSGADGFAGDFGDEPPAPADKEAADGFAGDFGDEPEPEPEKAAPEPKEAADGFAGDFGDEPEPEPEPEPAVVPPKDAEPEKEAADGFAGDFGDEVEDEETKEGPAAGDGFAGDFGDEPGPAVAAKVDPEDEDLSFDSEGEEQLDDFDSLPMIDVKADPSAADTGPRGGPPPEGSFGAWVVGFVDAIKIDWIDIFLRQLVIIVAFFGAMVATHRRKHINIDALSKVLSAGARRWSAVLVDIAAITVCLVLASAGMDLVKIGQEYPKELLPWAQEWHFQLMFPLGFSLMALHFGVRLLEDLTGAAPTEAVAAVVASSREEVAEEAEEPDEPEDADAEDADGDEGKVR